MEGTECKIIKNIDGDTVWVSIPSLNIDKIKIRIVGYDTQKVTSLDMEFIMEHMRHVLFLMS